MANGFDIKLVTVNDEPSLNTGEFLLDRDNEVMYVGYMGSTDIDYRSNLPMRVVSAVFSRLPTTYTFIETHTISPIVSCKFSRIPTYNGRVIVTDYLNPVTNTEITPIVNTIMGNIVTDYREIKVNSKGDVE